MTTKQALDTANEAPPGERLLRYETICGPRGTCRHEPLVAPSGRWTWCPDCMTLFDDFGTAVNRILEMQ